MNRFQSISNILKSSFMGLVTLACTGLYGSGMYPIAQDVSGKYPFEAVGKVVTDSGVSSTGTLIADNLVITQAGAFLSELSSAEIQPDHFRWITSSSVTGLEVSQEVVAVYTYQDYPSVAVENGVESISALERDLMVLQLAKPLGSTPSALINVGNIETTGYRMIVGYASDLYSSTDTRFNVLHATGAGEAVNSEFGQVKGRLFHTGDLKASESAAGSPVFAYYDGAWSVDGFVVKNDVVDGSCYVLGIDSSVAEFITSLIEVSGGTVILPTSSVIQDLNNDLVNATVLNIGYGRLFSIAPEADADFHKFEVVQAGNYMIESFGLLDVNATLLNSTGQFMIEDDDSAGSVNYRINVFLKAGKYYLLTKPYTNLVSGDYGISLIHQEASTSVYADDGLASGTVVELGTESLSTLYHLAGSGEVDTFHLVVTNPGQFILKSSGDLDVKSKLFSVTATEAIPNQTSEIETIFDENDDFPGLVGNTVLDAFLPVGEYYVTLKARDSGEFGPYSIQTHFYRETLPVVDSDDGCGSLATAINWTPGKKVVGDFDVAGDRDTYKFTIAEAAAVSVQILSSTDVLWNLYDSNLNRIASSGKAVVNPLIEQTLASGTYYLVVAGFSETSYSIK